MKYFRIFKAKKTINQLNEAERREFASDIASTVLENIINHSTLCKIQEFKDVKPENFGDTEEDFLRICQIREKLEDIEKETVDKAYEKLCLDYLKYLKSIKVINNKNLIEVSFEYLTLHWIERVIHKRSSDVYSRLLEIKSKLTKSDLWSEELELIYRNTSFGNYGNKISPLVNCSVVIKRKDIFKLFDLTWKENIWPALNSEAFEKSIELGSITIWNSMANGMVPDLKLVFQEFSEL